MKLMRLFVLLAVLVSALAVLPVAAQEKAITVAWSQEPDSLNRMYTTMTFAEYTRQLHQIGAWGFDADLNPYPMIAAEIPSLENGGLSADGLTITIKLNPAAVWSDGTPITADDFVFTYEMITAESNTPLSRYPYDEFVTSVEAADAQTVVVNFNAPLASWLATLFTYILPKHVLQPVFESDGTLDTADYNRAPSVSSGPYIFEEWEVGSFMRFSKNENYWLGVPNIETVIVTFIPDSVSYVLAAASEQADIATFFDYPDIAQIEESGANKVIILPSGYNEAWFFNVNPETAHPAMLELNVRKALAMGFDRFTFTQDVLLGRTYPAASYWENTPYASPNVSAPPYDPAMAAQLLDEAGWVDSDGDGIRDKDGVALSLRYITNQRAIRGEVQVVAQQQLAEIGIEVVLENYPSDIYFNGYADGGPMATGQYDIAQFSQNPAFPDPDTNVFKCSDIPTPDKPTGRNWAGYCNPALDELLTAQATELDTAKRIALFHQIDELFSQDVVWVSIWHDPDLWSFNQRIQNIALNSVTPFWNIEKWDVQ
jgi:peptide/nickel transport system substrate-binding protein